MQTSYDVIVLGLGAMGSAAAFELARRGRRVLGLEQFTPGHDQGSSHGQTRIIRKAYFEHPSYVPLLHRAYERWFDLEQRQGRHLFTQTGLLSLGKPEGELIAGVKRAASEHGLAIEDISRDDLRRRFPQFQVDDDQVGLLEPTAGFLYVEDCVRAHADEARKLGAELHLEEPALDWAPQGQGVIVRTAKGSYTADRLVVSAGAWAGRLLADLGLPLTVSRKVLAWFGTRDDSMFRRDRFPIYLTEVPEGVYYGFPVIDSLGAKVARHDNVAPVEDPATVDRTLSPADVEECRPFLAKHIPAIDGPLLHGKICLYTLTPDRHFVMDVHPQYPQVALAAGFSGHGFKFASVVGEILADLADKGRTDLPIDMFRVDRFSR